MIVNIFFSNNNNIYYLYHGQVINKAHNPYIFGSKCHNRVDFFHFMHGSTKTGKMRIKIYTDRETKEFSCTVNGKSFADKSKIKLIAHMRKETGATKSHIRRNIVICEFDLDA